MNSKLLFSVMLQMVQHKKQMHAMLESIAEESKTKKDIKSLSVNQKADAILSEILYEVIKSYQFQTRNKEVSVYPEMIYTMYDAGGDASTITKLLETKLEFISTNLNAKVDCVLIARAGKGKDSPVMILKKVSFFF